jgi:hypothetical protein
VARKKEKKERPIKKKISQMIESKKKVKGKKSVSVSVNKIKGNKK